jgi:hypothetical protein
MAGQFLIRLRDCPVWSSYSPARGQAFLLASPLLPLPLLFFSHSSFLPLFKMGFNRLLKMPRFIFDMSLLLTLLFSPARAYQGSLAPLAIQQRGTYNGGWALGLSGDTCPSDAPVQCGGGGTNPMCCPPGQTCFGTTALYCCPTGASPSSSSEAQY